MLLENKFVKIHCSYNYRYLEERKVRNNYEQNFLDCQQKHQKYQKCKIPSEKNKSLYPNAHQHESGLKGWGCELLFKTECQKGTYFSEAIW